MEKFNICPTCGELKKESDILKEIEAMGGTGMCTCCFTRAVWSEKYNDLDVDTPREYTPYVKISKRWYDRLSMDKNDVLRLDTFNQIPKDKLIES